MSRLSGDKRAHYVHGIFSRIAGRYDRMNRLMTGGQDTRWRRDAIRRLQLGPGMRLLDLGAGTGDLGREALKQQPDIRLVAVDFSLDMIRTGARKGRLPWVNADALRLPFPDGCFQAVVSGFLLRNVSNLSGALAEQGRILKPGGRIAVLETTRPRRSLFTPLVWLHMHIIIPCIGGLIAHDREAYRYLPASSEAFLSAEALAGQMIAAGFTQVGFQRKMFGTIAIHWGEKS